MLEINQREESMTRVSFVFLSADIVHITSAQTNLLLGCYGKSKSDICPANKQLFQLTHAGPSKQVLAPLKPFHQKTQKSHKLLPEVK